MLVLNKYIQFVLIILIYELTTVSMFNIISDMFNIMSGMFNIMSGMFNIMSGMFNIMSGTFNIMSGKFNISLACFGCAFHTTFLLPTTFCARLPFLL
jgi:hypothetical protein